MTPLVEERESGVYIYTDTDTYTYICIKIQRANTARTTRASLKHISYKQKQGFRRH